MRINRFVAQATDLSRRKADIIIAEGRVTINGEPAVAGSDAAASDAVKLDGKALSLPIKATTIMLNKPAGYVCSRAGQGSKTIYGLLPASWHKLNPVGRLDKDSSGLLLMTDDGDLANRLTHPRYGKDKVYEVSLDKPLGSQGATLIRRGVELEDGPSRLGISDNEGKHLTVTMSEGRNRQIRRTFAALDYTVTGLHRIKFGNYNIGNLSAGKYKKL